jgi:hypothetical protein
MTRLALLLALLLSTVAHAADFECKVAVFSADVTPPLGHRLLTGRRQIATAIDDPLFAKGFVLLPSDQKPIVVAVVDWAEIRNDAYDRWRDLLAEAAGTTRERVIVSCIHQHDTPLADLTAQKLLEQAGSSGQIIDLEFHEKTVRKVAEALKASFAAAVPATHVGIGMAEAKQLASNRRFTLPDGKVTYGRYSSSSGNAQAQAADEGTIDPLVRTLSLWNNDRPIVVLSSYATHPMSYYGTSRISADFPGLARARRQADTPDALQIYASGASGNVTVGKYNDGSKELRPVFADRLYQAMKQAFEQTKKTPLSTISFRNTTLELSPRESHGFTQQDLEASLSDKSNPQRQEMSALALSWRQRTARKQPIDVPAIDFGPTTLLLLPGEIYVEYQLYAQTLRKDHPVVVLGYGESAPGYLPIERAWEENDENLSDWCWVAPAMEERTKKAIEEALRSGQSLRD